MAHRSPQGQNHKATEATRCLMPENQKKTPCARLPKRNPDSKPNSDTTPTSDDQIQRPEMTGNGREIEISKPNSDTTPASDGQIQRPEMTGNGREIEISKLTFRQQAALPRIALAQLAQAARDTRPSLGRPRRRITTAAYGPSLPRKRAGRSAIQPGQERRCRRRFAGAKRDAAGPCILEQASERHSTPVRSVCRRLNMGLLRILSPSPPLPDPSLLPGGKLLSIWFLYGGLSWR